VSFPCLGLGLLPCGLCSALLEPPQDLDGTTPVDGEGD
jgi:hypothetical protein